MTRFLLSVYVAACVGNAAVMSYLMPALNWKGAVYIALTTPAYPFCYVAGCDPMPSLWLAKHLFTFTGAADDRA